MLLSLRNVVIIAVLVASMLTSMPATYVFAVVEGEENGEQKKGNDDAAATPKKETETAAVGSSSSQQDTPKPNQEGTPPQQDQQQEGSPKTTTKTTTTLSTDLPKCDGSKQDCVTKNGDTCKAGVSTGHECECADDMHDCPNHPSVVVNPIIPAMTIPPPKPTVPDFECHFHPNDDRCKPDANGNCPPGFAHNEKGNCHPSGPCPTGFVRHDDDESGTCFPGPHPCPNGFHLGPHHTCIKIVKNTVVHTSSSSSSHSLSGKCFDEIKIAWLGKISRGENSRVDSIIDKCLNIH